MFYSHTFLARKGPLGTVWCAAHLQHRLKKSHYTSTDISSTVECIMYPEVPIALRMVGHLLLGVVRIYSKKVDYLYQDYNFFLISIRKAFAAVEVNLPEDATHAPFHSVTLPDKYELDAVNLEDDFYNEGVQDNHLRSQDEITLTVDQIPTGRDPYITIAFEEETLRDLLHSEDASGSGARTMEDLHTSSPVLPTSVSEHPVQTGDAERLDEDNIPEFEVMRDPGHDINVDSNPLWPDQGNDVIEPDKILEQMINEKENPTPGAEEILVSGGHSPQSQQHAEPHISDASDQAPDSTTHISFGHVSPEFAIPSIPQVAQPKARPRKRKQLFDEATVLTNKYGFEEDSYEIFSPFDSSSTLSQVGLRLDMFMKGALHNCSDLRRKRKCCPSSDLDVWKSNNRLRKEKIFLEPLITGLCADLCNTYKTDLISVKPHLASVKEASTEPSVAESPAQMHEPVHDLDMEIEHLRNYEGPVGSNILHEIIGSPNRMMPSETRSMSSPHRNDFTPASADLSGSESELQQGKTVGTGAQPTPDLAASTGTFVSETETPMTTFTEWRGLESTGLPDIPEVMDSSEEDDLHFLASEDYTPIKYQRTLGVDKIASLSGTTRKVVEYLKDKSSVTPISEDLSGDMNLNNILKGKSRKVCARMFFETLVLKSYELVDVQQEEPYGDITLKLTPNLFKN